MNIRRSLHKAVNIRDPGETCLELPNTLKMQNKTEGRKESAKGRLGRGDGEEEIRRKRKEEDRRSSVIKY